MRLEGWRQRRPRKRPSFETQALAQRATGLGIQNIQALTSPKPGCWRAAITRKVRSRDVVGGDKVQSVVTPDDYASESEAELAAQKLIRKL
jgi:hypothetical protein